MNHTLRATRCAVFFLGLVLSAVAGAAEFTVEETDRGVKVDLDGKPFTEYLTNVGKKPALSPIIGPTGKPMTCEPGPKDHPHHASMWFAFGDVNHHDLWREKGATGSTVHREFVETSGGPTAKIVTRNDWLGRDGKKLCEDERTITCSVDGDNRIVDFDIKITASDGEVRLGDTKEGAFAVRVREDVATKAKKGGHIVNSDGLTDDAAWGKKSPWVDYYGPIDGETLGIAILNHPSSYGFPTYWHVRDYGLFAANPFGVRDFTSDKNADGSHTLKPGESITLRHRVIFHKGDEKEGRIAESYERYAKPSSAD